MMHRRQAVAHRTDDALRRRIGTAQFGMRGFKRDQLGEQLVVVGVGDGRGVVDVISLRMALDLGAQLLSAALRGGRGQLFGAVFAHGLQV